MTPNMHETLAWLRAEGFIVGKHGTPSLPQTDATQSEKGRLETMQHTPECTLANDNSTREICLCIADDLSRGFSAGNYANAYETTDLDECDLDDKSAAYCTAFVLGFFSSYSLDEIGSAREEYDECYWSDYGARVLAAGYCDSRHEDYQLEASEE